jgi:nitroreductase
LYGRGKLTDDLKTESLTAVEAAIVGRRTIKQFRAQPVERETLQRLIDLAVWAPNHRVTEPWRFYLLGEQARARVGEIAQTIQQRKMLEAGGTPEVAERKGAEAGAAWAGLPALLYVTYVTDANPEIDLENYGAVCCAMQNFMLAAFSVGIGTSWSSGAVAAAPELHALVGADKTERMVGLFRVGYMDPGAQTPASRRAPGAIFTRWVEV